MKLFFSLAIATLIQKSQGATLRNSSRKLASSNEEIVTLTLTNECNYDALKKALAEECDADLNELLGRKRNQAHAEARVQHLCEKAIANQSDVKKYAHKFSDITGEGYQFDSVFYDGGTALNAEYESVNIADSRGGSKIQAVYDDVSESELIEFPDQYLKENFLTDCAAQAVMCCWVQDRQADNDGNCANGDCEDKDPADNTDICYVDMEAASKSNHVEGGFALFPGDSEGDAHCHGFAWSNDETSADYRYRGNALFYVSMYDHLNVRGYVRNVPGSTMCSCIDKSPTVSRSDCTNVDVTETFTFSKNPNNDKISYAIIDADIEFNNCDGTNDLAQRYAALKADGNTTQASDEVFDKHVVGDCDDGDHYENFLETKGFRTK